jgi:hypothetical protein
MSRELRDAARNVLAEFGGYNEHTSQDRAIDALRAALDADPEAGEGARVGMAVYERGRRAGLDDALAVVRGLNGNGHDEPSDPALTAAEAAIERLARLRSEDPNAAS